MKLRLPLILCYVLPILAQDIRIYSEFERIDPFGNVIRADRGFAPREILSPAMARNGHLTVHVVITAPEGTNYFLYTAASPADILRIKVYREHFTPCGADYCPDWLTEVTTPSFGAIPEMRQDLTRPALRYQTTRCYLLDIWAPPDTPPRRVRVEALMKIGTWFVAPMEVRIAPATVPEARAANERILESNIAPVEMQSSATAERQLLRHTAGLPPQWPISLLRVRDFIQRNAAEDALIAPSEGPISPELNLRAWWPLLYPQLGAEWYLKVRDLLFQQSSK